jgi:hypothetical protein
MAYVAKDDIILELQNEVNFVQGNETVFELFLYKDFIGNPLNLNEPTSFHAAIFSGDQKVLQYSYPLRTTVSDSLNVFRSEGEGRVSFTVTDQQALSIKPGQIHVEFTVLYENYYPAPKSYIFPRLLLGEVVAGEGGNTGEPNPGTGGGGTSVVLSPLEPRFMIESIADENPTTAGMMSMNSNVPASVTQMTFRNLDSRNTRITILENFLTNRIGLEDITGIITIKDVDTSTNMYAIYKILDWERIDITAGNGDADNSDGIRILVSLEDKSYGPGVTKNLWEVGQDISFELDAVGITRSELTPDGISTYVDKNLNPIATTGDESPTGITISYSPYYDSYVTIEVNGISVELGDGTKDKDAYFSGNHGLTAAKIEEIRAGDQLIWNGTLAGYDLEEGDEVNLIYEVAEDDLR